ncbi:uncharacterized protein LOC126555848 [Aphis gossypii]|uniref:uncharacterized protein LOC126555848 n=1 Tax=Aphis gossypii TaxID=80765 RepID=UPI002158E2F3|nr:uncharacterized protein LOC126555848 [Aphis gossypii]XP_050066713.1 uncharacterized protein LOC126555848 [Aphis gossypii]
MKVWNSVPKAGTWTAASCMFIQRFLEIVSIFLLDNQHVIMCLTVSFMTSWTIILYSTTNIWLLYVARLITGSVILIFTSSLPVEMVGRREFLLISDFVMALCLGTLGFYFWQQGHEVDVSSYNLIPFISLGTYIFMCTLGSDPIPRVMIRNVLNPERIGFAIGIVCLCASLVQLCVVKTYQVLLDTTRGYELTDMETFKRRFAAVFPPSGVPDSPKSLEVAVSDAPRTIDEHLPALEDAVRSLSAEFAPFTFNHVLTNRAPIVQAPTNQAPTVQAPKVQAPTSRAPPIDTSAPTRTVPKSWCYYHTRFGKDAHKCSSDLCTFYPKISTKNKTFKKSYTSGNPSKLNYRYNTWTDF